LPPETDAIIEEVLSREPPELITGETGFANSSGREIWYESISPEGAAKGVVLLLMGSGGDGLGWPARFVSSFVNAGYQTIRYDHRGTGMSDGVKDWDRRNPYTLTDMAGDAIAVLDANGVQAAHLIGLSMGGMIAQEVAAQAPDRVASLTLLMTSGYVGDPELPGLSTRHFLRSVVKALPLLRYRLLGGERNLIKERIAKQVTAMGYAGLDIRQIAEAVLYDLRRRRGINLRGVIQHVAAVSLSGSRYEKLKALNLGALVIHGTADPIFPIAHGKKLVATIPAAEGLWLDGVGHGIPVPDMDALESHILAYLERTRAREATVFQGPAGRSTGAG
jgi:pimeloyl-ACP methyl ester carboxylesterase